MKKYATKGNIFQTSDGFKIKNDGVNRYLSQFNITSKVIRGYNANDYVIKRLKSLDIKDESERKKKFLEVIKTVAAEIGHTPNMLRNSYLKPEIEDNFIKRGKV